MARNLHYAASIPSSIGKSLELQLSTLLLLPNAKKHHAYTQTASYNPFNGNMFSSALNNTNMLQRTYRS